MQAAIPSTEPAIPLTEPITLKHKPLFQKPEVEKRLEAPHYLFTALNAIEPRLLRERRERPELRAGGMLVASPCLRHVDGFVRRGCVTPLLENVYDPVAREEADGSDQKGLYLELPMLAPMHGDPLGIPLANPLKTRLAKPGLHLPLILNGSTNVRGGNFKGLVEIRDLRYADYDPVEIDKIHRAIYPTWPKLPVRIADLREMIEAARSSYLATTIEDMLLSCEQAELYMTRVIDQVHFEMENPRGENGRVPQYTGLHYTFLEQLGIQPKARTVHQSAPPAASPDLKEMFQLFREASKEDRQEFIGAIKSLVGRDDERIVEQLEAELPAEREIELPAEREAERFICECNKEFPTVAGLRMHKSRHCSLLKAG